MKINIETCPLKKMRYKTAGDYWKDSKGVWQFRVLELHNVLYEVLILVHELVEWSMCLAAGIKIKDIDEFDIQFEKDREIGLHDEEEEPGGHPESPYRHQHDCASKIEQVVCNFFGVKWDMYEKAVTRAYR